ncbi:division/cell wall cluster transcriptional repressor MraZ [Candidatus Roizmanbacteria bacterium CG22_combo_CG10-13_8_21_14_all_35_9]|uniref:Transcriptional regulator MraZ n=4 Tax=Candidatus Roizmaniibacteriota TaxID=1752723 RepID=A0A2M8F1H9_9BACT|nr:MAG: division/cell wall cluster transcriptional repressor MraZ [Candidatus Roizmanbacteria bacterium CG23_combo_of_CG06-09_8_20_14_all_35_49]PIP62916.1 MAG: division/cell wall cluster transcriptional repressor MraZ [Candidatus Roizmanbacteria bacterium CG22_combo_CG10-13_8_21_14_all_35_9]PIY71431.1 MAG: division/cell wall cluster transcriptional repressor MraZ [Candidatus Roizmanbacteria bacterium CG_4_10_14_0_8_um_filter_35_28]PJC33127.1 MAG: division/cell wall cluster transcriptional repres
MVFFGEYQINFSGSGRLLLPKKVREPLKGNTFILTKGFGNCLAGYDKDDWEKRASELLNPSLLQPTDMDNRRYIFSSLVYLEIDEQGRFVVPKNLLEYGQLKEKIVIIGVGDHFEIWNNDQWIEYRNNLKKNIKNLANA